MATKIKSVSIPGGLGEAEASQVLAWGYFLQRDRIKTDRNL